MPEHVAARTRLGSIRAVTYTVADLDAVESAYTHWLHHRVVARGRIPQAAAIAWRAEQMAERAFMILQPRSGEPVYLRFIEHPSASGWRALTTHGWNVSELVVQDVDALAASFDDSPFRIIGPATGLQRFPMIRAMQVIGPCGECLYFTEVGAGSGLELASARSHVGRVFIVVAGGPDLDALSRTYSQFANEVEPPVATRVRVISLVNGLLAETEHRHSLVKLASGTLIELDEYPPVTRARTTLPGCLAPGMAMVTFAVHRLPERDGAAAHPVLLPDADARAVVIAGAAGELIELMESDDA